MNTRPTPETDVVYGNEPSGRYIGDKLCRKLERERDEAREETEAMREAIKEAHEALMSSDDCGDLSEALAKLQPFITP